MHVIFLILGRNAVQCFVLRYWILYIILGLNSLAVTEGGVWGQIFPLAIIYEHMTRHALTGGKEKESKELTPHQSVQLHAWNLSDLI